jgi:hypothetical protein
MFAVHTGIIYATTRTSYKSVAMYHWIRRKSIEISRDLDAGRSLEMVYKKWVMIKRKMRKAKYRSKKSCDTYDIHARVDEIQDVSDLAALLCYYADRWNPRRIWIFDLAFKKILRKTVSVS